MTYMLRTCVFLIGLLALLAAQPGTTAPQATGRPLGGRGCDLCHAELELLRQHTPSLEAARSMWTSSEVIEGSAHGGISCVECHTDFGPFPHSSTPRAETRSCQSCHQDALEPWRVSVHGPNGDREGPAADCTGCHGVHDVAAVEELSAGTSAGAALNDRCGTCHEARVLPGTDPHADSTLCADCHAPHDTRAVRDPGSRVAPANQGTTCGACHEDNASAWMTDVHGSAVLGNPLPRPEHPERETGGHGAEGPALEDMDPASCTSCHGGHDIHEVDEERLAGNSTAVCEGCHVAYTSTYLDSYHGQATTLGSRAAADCAACHSGHEIFPTRDARSWVSEENLLATCQTCHPRAGVKFAGFAPHVDHTDREQYPQVYWTYLLMTGLLLGVFAFFGLHSILWLARLTVLGKADTDSKGGTSS